MCVGYSTSEIVRGSQVGWLRTILRKPVRLFGSTRTEKNDVVDVSTVVSQLVREGHGPGLSRYYLSNWDSDLLMADDFEAWQKLNLYQLLGSSELKHAIRLLV